MNRIVFIVTLIITLLAAYTEAAAATASCPAVSDVYIDEVDPTLNFNDKTRLLFSFHPTKGKARALLKFDIPVSIDASQIQSAVLHLSSSGHTGGGNAITVNSHALNSPFGENAETWNTHSGGDYDSALFSPGGLPAGNTWETTIDVTTLLTGNLNKVRDNGILIKLATEGPDKLYQNIASRECDDASDPNYVEADEPPRLEITYAVAASTTTTELPVSSSSSSSSTTSLLSTTTTTVDPTTSSTTTSLLPTTTTTVEPTTSSTTTSLLPTTTTTVEPTTSSTTTSLLPTTTTTVEPTTSSSTTSLVSTTTTTVQPTTSSSTSSLVPTTTTTVWPITSSSSSSSSTTTTAAITTTSSTSSSTTIVYQPYICDTTADVYIDEVDPALNFNDKTRLLISFHPTKGKARTLLKFDIPGSIEASQIQSAVLHLSSSGHTGGGNAITVNSYALNSPFGENAETWDTHSGGDYDSVLFSSGALPAGNAWKTTIDVTALLTGNLNKVRTNGILIKLATEGPDKSYQNIASRECDDLGNIDYDEKDEPPVLVINYAAPEPTTTVEPSTSTSTSVATTSSSSTSSLIPTTTTTVQPTTSSSSSSSTSTVPLVSSSSSSSTTTTSIVTTTSSTSSTTTMVYQSYTCATSADVYIDEESPATNFNDKTRVLISYHPDKGVARGLWKFSIPGIINAAQIESATLHVSGSIHTGGGTALSVYCYALNTPFDENVETWNTHNGGDYDTGVFSSGSLPSGNDWEAVIDVTTLAKGNLAKLRNNGMLMRKQQEGPTKEYQNIASRETTDPEDFTAYLKIVIASTGTTTTTAANTTSTMPVTTSTTTTLPATTSTTAAPTTSSTSSTTSTVPLPPPTTTSTTTTTALCPVVKMFNSENSHEVTVIRAFRNRRMAQSINGLVLIYLYYTNAEELTSIFSADQELSKSAAELIRELTPALEVSLEQNTSMTITPEQYDEIITILRSIRVKASPRLQSIIDYLMKRLESGELQKAMSIAIETLHEGIMP